MVKLHSALLEKRSFYQERHEKAIFLHNHAPLQSSVMVKSYFKSLNLEVLFDPVRSEDLATSDYHTFLSMRLTVTEQHFHSPQNL